MVFRKKTNKRTGAILKSFPIEVCLLINGFFQKHSVISWVLVMVYLVFVLYDIYIYIYKCWGGKVKIHHSFEKIKYSSHTPAKLMCGLVVLTVCWIYIKGSTNSFKSVLREKAFLGGVSTSTIISFVKYWSLIWQFQKRGKVDWCRANMTK